MDFDKMIDDKKQEKAIIVEKMDSKKGEILEEFVIFTKDWFDEQIIRSIKDHSDKLLDLGEEKAKSLKEKTIELRDNTTQLVDKHMNIPSIWWHEAEKSATYYLSSNQILPDLTESTKYLLGELGVILLEYGLENTTDKYSRVWDKDFGSGKVKYGFGLSYSDKLCDLSKDYAALVETGRKINDEISKTENKKKRENIEEWWSAL